MLKKTRAAAVGRPS